MHKEGRECIKMPPNTSTEYRNAQRAYHKQWRKAHKESVEAAQMRYWTKKAREKALRSAQSAGAEGGNEPDED